MEVLIGAILMIIMQLLKKYVKNTLRINTILIILSFFGGAIYCYLKGSGELETVLHIFAYAGSIYGIIRGFKKEFDEKDEITGLG